MEFAKLSIYMKEALIRSTLYGFGQPKLSILGQRYLLKTVLCWLNMDVQCVTHDGSIHMNELIVLLQCRKPVQAKLRPLIYYLLLSSLPG